MARDPAFLFYTQDFLIGTQFMSHEETGYYIRVMCAFHQHGRLTKERIESLYGKMPESILEKLATDEDGRLFNSRLETEIDKRKKFTESRRENLKRRKEAKNTHMDSHMEHHMAPHMENANENENTSRIKEESEKGMKQAYSFLDKNFITVHDFIKDNRPEFPEPFFDLWNFFAKETGKPSLRKLTTDRRKKIMTRIREPEFNYLEILSKSRDSNLIRNGTWFSFDWFMDSESNYLKILEGNYDNTKIQNLIKDGTQSHFNNAGGNSRQQQHDAVNGLLAQTQRDIDEAYPRTG